MSTKSYAIACGLPIDEAVRRLHESAAELDEAAEKQPGRTESFGERIAAIARRDTRGRSGLQPGEEPTFGERILAAVKRLDNASDPGERRLRLRPRRRTASD